MMWNATCISRRFLSTTPVLNGTNSIQKKIIQRMQKLERNEQLKAMQKPAPFTYDVESILAERFIKNNIDQFESIKRREEIENEKAQLERPPEKPVFPFAFRADPEVFKIAAPVSEGDNVGGSTEGKPLDDVDRGFFLTQDDYTDDYTAATTADLPEESMTEPYFEYYNVEDAIEEIELTRKSKPIPRKTLEEFEEDEIEESHSSYGTEDTSLMPSTFSGCSGCGAKFHCQDSALPGFIPVQLFKKVLANESKKRTVQELCRRCYMLKNYNFLLNVNVAEVDYKKLMGHLKLVQEALIVLVVDMTDIQGSIYRALPQILGDRKPMIVVGNKVDLLPPDRYYGYMRNWQKVLRLAIWESGLSERFNVLNITMVSAKTGYGVEDLITQIFTNWTDQRISLRGDIYLVGCTNAGKSTLFNAFLQSDLCKVKALDLVDRVTTSIWPGTTLSLLKFPLMTPTAYRLEERKDRLALTAKWIKKERYLRSSMYAQTKDPKYLSLMGLIGNTFEESDKEQELLSKDERDALFEPEMTMGEKPRAKSSRQSLNHPALATGKWMYDTPGTVNKESQILNLFTLDELINVVPRQMIVPRTTIMKRNETLLIGGIARIDCIDMWRPESNRDFDTYLTVFTSEKLPLNVMRTDEVSDFLKEYNGTPLIGAPLGGPDRLKLFPKLIGVECEVSGLNAKESSTDIVISSIGWVSVTSWNSKIKLRVATPAGKGIFIRQPPLVKYALEFRGRRIRGTSIYETLPLETLPKGIKPREHVPWEIKEQPKYKRFTKYKREKSEALVDQIDKNNSVE